MSYDHEHSGETSTGFGSHELPNQTLWIRVYCIITAFAVDEDRISAGESDLRLIGEVLRLFHETPVLAPIDVGGEVMQAQVVLQPLGLDQIQQLWQTQSEVAYRPSVAYEVEFHKIGHDYQCRALLMPEQVEVEDGSLFATPN